MDIYTVGQHSQTKFAPRNFYDLEFRKTTESLLVNFGAHFKMNPFGLEWKNIGQENDIYAMGVALRINSRYQINYMLVAEDFDLWYFDTVNPKEIVTLEESDCLEDMMSELFKHLAEDQARDKAAVYFDTVDERGDFPRYEDEPPRKKQKPDTKILETVLKM